MSSFVHSSGELAWRRGAWMLSVLRTRGVLFIYTGECFSLRLEPLPHERHLVWLDPMEVRLTELWVMRVISLLRNYGLLRLHGWLFFVPGLRVHEAERFRTKLLRLWLFMVIGIQRGHRRRVPWSWQFFETYASGIEGRVAEPRLSYYVDWWVLWILWTMARCHRPWVLSLRRSIMRSKGWSIDFNTRRYGFMGVLRMSARATPPDVRSLRIVATPRVIRRELSLYAKRVEQTTKDRMQSQDSA